MTVRGCLAGLLLSLVFAGSGRADERAALKKIDAADTAAVASFKAGNAEKAKDQLLDAIVLGKENGLEDHAVMARIYLHLAAVQLEGLKDEEKARRYFGLALRIRPDIQPTGPLATAAVTRELERARGGARASAPAPSAPAASAEDPDRLRQAETAAAEARARDKMATAVLQEKERELKERDQKAREEREKLGKDLAVLQDREKREREGREKLLAEKQELEKQLAEARAREQKEREDKERVNKINQELEKQLIEARDKEKKEREAKEQLQAAEKERQTRAGQEKVAREKLADGPDMPGTIPQPIYCPTRDEWATGADVFIHCVPQSEVKAKELALYYRPSGAVHFNSLLMERSKKGWYVASIPGSRVTGRMLQYYVEARGPKGEVAAANGKANSPNIMMIRPGAQAEAPAAASTSKLTSASSTERKSRSGRRERKGR